MNVMIIRVDILLSVPSKRNVSFLHGNKKTSGRDTGMMD